MKSAPKATQHQLGEKCLLVRQLHIRNEVTPAQFINKHLQTQKEKDRQNKEIQDQLNKSQDNLSEVDIEHIKTTGNQLLSIEDGAVGIIGGEKMDDTNMLPTEVPSTSLDFGQADAKALGALAAGLGANSASKLTAQKRDLPATTGRGGEKPQNEAPTTTSLLEKGFKGSRNHLTSQNLHDVLSKYMRSVNGHRNLCRVVDFEVSEKSALTESSGPSNQYEQSIYLISESYNLSLFDLFCTAQAEKTILSEEFLIEVSFQVLKGIEYLNRNSKVTPVAGSLQSKIKGLENGFQGMLRMQNILFDDRGQVKVQDLSHVFFDEYEVKEADLIYLPPEVLKGGYIIQQASHQQGRGRRGGNKGPVLLPQFFQLNSSMDVWALGMVLLHCICLDYHKGSEDTIEEILNIYSVFKAKGPSLINLEDKLRAEEMEKQAEEENADSDQGSLQGKEDNASWMNLYKGNRQSKETELSKFLTLKFLDNDRYSQKFLNFLKECLTFDPNNRPKAFDILSHPIFRKSNKLYLSQQVALTRPITSVEKHALNKMRARFNRGGEDSSSSKKESEEGEDALPVGRDIKIKQFLDIIKLKVQFEKRISFLQFLMKSFSQINSQAQEQASVQFKGFNSKLLEQATAGESKLPQRLMQESRHMRKKRIPQLVRVINKEENQFSQKFKYGSNLRLLRENNYQSDLLTMNKGAQGPSADNREFQQVSNFLILKSDLSHLRQLNEESVKMVLNDLKSIIQAPSKAKKALPTDQASVSSSGQMLDQQTIISDGSSVYSSASAILDSISSIFSIRSAQSSSQPMPTPGSDPSVTSSQKSFTQQNPQSVRCQKFDPQSQEPQEDVDDKIQDYLLFQTFLKKNSAVSTDQNVLKKMIRKYSDILRICKNLRTKAFKRLFAKSNGYDGWIEEFLSHHPEVLKNNESIMSKSDLSQIRKDIDRISLHPVLKSEEVRSQLYQILCTFVTISNFSAIDTSDDESQTTASSTGEKNPAKVSYIQSIDTIGSSLYVMGFESHNSEFIELLPQMLKHVFEEYSSHFLDPTTGHLDFKYSSILMTRLLNFFDPELANDMKDIDHGLYLIKWFMTLFAHTLPLKVLHESLWIDLFCERVDYLFFVAIAILIQMKDRLLLQKKVAYSKEEEAYEEGFGLHSLAIIQILSSSLPHILEKDIQNILDNSKKMRSLTPLSFISPDLTFKESKESPSSAAMKSKKEEYLARRWWDSEKLDTLPQICVPLISVEDCVDLKKQKFLVDVRPFARHQYSVYRIADNEQNKYANFLDCHVKNSYYMADTVTLLEMSSKNQDNSAYERDLEKLQKISQVQIDFLQAYRENYPENVIVVIGNRHNFGEKFAQFLVDHGQVSKVCILKGGIDAYRMDFPQLLRKASSNHQTEQDFLLQYERFIKKAQTMKVQKQKKLDMQGRK